MNRNYISTMALADFQYEPVSLDVNRVCFEEEQGIPNTREKSRKTQLLLSGVSVGHET